MLNLKATKGALSVGMLTLSEVAWLLHVHRNSVRRWANPGLLESYRVGGRGDRSQSQGNAAEGVVGHRRVLHRVIVPRTPRTTPIEVVQAALQRDPISVAYRNGGVLLHDEVVVE